MTRRPYPHLPLALALIAGAGCAAHRGGASLDALNARTPLDFRGHYEIGAGSWFRPCGAAAADSAWWVTVTGAAVAQLDSARTAGQLRVGEASYVEWSAVLTRGGEVGPRGPGAPALLVREVRSIRLAGADDCSGSDGGSAARPPS